MYKNISYVGHKFCIHPISYLSALCNMDVFIIFLRCFIFLFDIYIFVRLLLCTSSACDYRNNRLTHNVIMITTVYSGHRWYILTFYIPWKLKYSWLKKQQSELKKKTFLGLIYSEFTTQKLCGCGLITSEKRFYSTFQGHKFQ